MIDTPSTRPSLLVRLRDAGDADAWGDFVRLYGPAIYAFARGRGLQDADAADLTQDVFRAAARSLGRFEYAPALGKFRGWLFTLVRREWIRRFPPGRPAALPLESAPEPSGGDDPAELWERECRRRWFHWALEQVRPRVSKATFRAFTLTALEGRSGREAARELGVSEAAVYLARGRVLARLREVCLALEGEDAP